MPLAAVNGIFVLTVSAQVAEKLIKVPNGGVSALLITRSRLSFGSIASSSARWVPPVLTELIGVTKLTLELMETTRLRPSVAKIQGDLAATPLGPWATLLGIFRPVSPPKLKAAPPIWPNSVSGPVDEPCPANAPVVSMTSSALLDR